MQDLWKVISSIPSVRNYCLSIMRRVDTLACGLSTKSFIDIHSIDRSILIIGSPRSGTTWISNLINHSNNCRYIFEPDHPCVEEMKVFGEQPYYVPVKCRDIKQIEGITKILSGNIKQTFWVNQYNHRGFSTRRIIKMVRGHFLLGWIRDLYPQLELVYIMRHPIPVFLSKIETDTSWKNSDDFYSNFDLRKSYLEPFEYLIASADTGFKKSILAWCIQNYVALKDLEKQPLNIVFYEDFFLHPELNTRELCDRLSLQFNKQDFEYALKKSYKSDKKWDEHNRLEDWFTRISREQLDYALSCLRTFRLDLYYYDSLYPVFPKTQ
jgi:hypothetical protein